MEVRKEAFVLERGIDTLWESVDFELREDPMLAMTYHLVRPFRYEERYRLTMDSAMFCGVYGHCNDSLSATMTVKSEKDYGHLIVVIQGLPPATADLSSVGDVPGDMSAMQDSINVPAAGDTVPDLSPVGDVPDDAPDMPSVADVGNVVPAFMELLNNSGSPVAKAMVENGVATFNDMAPDKYYARLILDTNGNSLWDAGNYEERRQPEPVVYFMSQFEIRQNWKIEETWDISRSKPGEKPYELLKNKPKEETKKKRDYKQESKPGKSNSSSTSIRGLGGIGF